MKDLSSGVEVLVDGLPDTYRRNDRNHDMRLDAVMHSSRSQ